MCRLWLATSIALCACVPSMVRAPKQIPASGIVECTDTVEVPVAATVVAVVSAGAAAYAATHMEGTIEHGGVFWLPLLGTTSLEALYAAGVGYSYAHECTVAKQLGAEQAELARRKASARAEAGMLWKRAAAAARSDDCATVRELDPQIRGLDVEFHAVVFARDVAIARCLAKPITNPRG